MTTLTVSPELASAAQLPSLEPGRWTIDPSHSTVGFEVRHLMFTKVRGRFERFEGQLEIGQDLLDSKVETQIETASIETGDAKRDTHLRSADFFEVERHPLMQFQSTRLRREGRDLVLDGDLVIRDIRRPVSMQLELEGVGGDPWGGTRAGFTAQTVINRKDFGLDWNVALEAGGVLVGEQVKIVLDIQAVRD